ncbi:Cna B-type domain-containing protein [Butyrivibrio sp. AE3004]|uniref:Cna B-type domain-containing protein n=1 Tax=Butyrivibrio sp. AE3004 TaxID=1506994 RepID=UPI0012DD34CC|nr:Cna B-type domain-containing protein [Butyrivibrio sp. AE3004]
MRKLENNRIEGFVKKHIFLKKWVSVMLVIAILVTTGTMYALNKSASAVSEETAEDVGMVISSEESENTEVETASAENDTNQTVEEVNTEGTEASENNANDSASTESTTAESQGTETTGTEQNTEETANNSENGETEKIEENNTSAEENAASTEESTNASEESATTEEGNASSEEGSSTEENKSDVNGTEKTEESVETIKLADSAETVLTENVVLKVAYVDEENNAIAEEKEISLSESLDFATEAPKQEGYEFKQAAIDGNVITKIFAKQDDNGFKYYEVNKEDDTTVVVKENKTVVLTYARDVVVEGGIKLTAKYVDKDGTVIKDAQDLCFTAETELATDAQLTVDGYFYLGAAYIDQKITKITPIFTENSEAAADGENKVTVKEYKLFNGDNEAATVEEDTEIVLTYAKATSETSFEYSDEKVVVKAQTASDRVFPEGIELKVTEVTTDTQNYNYDAYMNALNENAECIAKDAGLEETTQYNEYNTVLYDIAFIYEGKEIQPKEGSVNISIEFKDNKLSEELLAEKKEDITVVHLPIKEEVKKTAEIENTEDATEIKAEDVEVKTLTEATAEVDNGEDNNEKVEFTEDNFSIFAVISYQKHDPGTDDFKSVLGDAVNFGIIANELTIGESETNFAVKNAHVTLQSGNDMTNPAEQTYMAGSIDGEFHIKGYDAYFIIPENNANKVKHTAGASHLKIDTSYSYTDIGNTIDDMFTYIRAASKDLTAPGKGQIVWPFQSSDDRFHWKIYLLDRPAGTYYVNINDDYLGKIFREAAALQIFKRDDQTLVFNINSSKAVNMHKFAVSRDGANFVDSDTLAGKKGGENYSSISRSIIWNFTNATEVHSSTGVVGVFIAGKDNATFYNDTTSAGWIAFPNVVIGAGEFHNTYDEVQQISGTAQFQAYKTIDGKDATVSGFRFTLSKQEESGSWTDIQTVSNDVSAPHDVIFNGITYGGNATYSGNKNYQYVSLGVGDSKDFIYVIKESMGTTDSEGNSYTADSRYYFAKVTVTCVKQNDFTASVYYKVSAPSYYYDYGCTQPINEQLPTFDNKTTAGSAGIKLFKYLNNEDPGEHKYTFTVRALKKRNNGNNTEYYLDTLTNNLTNVGKDISYSFNYDGNYVVIDSGNNKRLYLVITENAITNDTKDSLTVEKDENYIIARVDLNADGNSVNNVYYFRYDKEDSTEAGYIKKIESGNGNDVFNGIVSDKTKTADNKIADASDVAFYNKGQGLLRIHKMVVNDFGSKFVRDNTGTALLDTVTFRITNNSSKNYIVFHGFTGDCRTEKNWATEYDSNHKEIKKYDVTYNGSAQWTISGLDAGTYTVDEVADGYTFGYDAASNTSSAIESTNMSRVTKYDVTVDDEESGEWHFKAGGNNYRKVYSIDIPNHYDLPPDNVVVGGKVQTVQVCNYYSIPIGPLQVTKNFTRGEWKPDMAFTFKIEPAGYSAYTSEGAGISLNSQPMPQKYGSTQIADTVTLTGANATYDEKTGKYTAIASFESIPFRYEGTYYYKITELDKDGNPYTTAIDGVQYDDTEIYVKVVVSKKKTTFTKDYKYKNMTHPDPNKYSKKYSGYGENEVYTQKDEDFYYLGADVTYASDIDFKNVLAECELHLGTNPDTVNYTNNEFIATYTEKDGVLKVAFNNTLLGKLTVSKKWLDTAEKDDSENHSVQLDLHLWQRTKSKADGTYSEWKTYPSAEKPMIIPLTKTNNWSYTVDELPLSDEDGNEYEYCVWEPSETAKSYFVSYSYNGGEAHKCEFDNTTTVDGEEVYNPGYSMKANGRDYGNVVITNQAFNAYALPSTGGVGTMPIILLGACMAIGSMIAMYLFRRKEEE